MINNNDFKYIKKRVIIGLTIAFILFNVNKCNAKALVYKDSVKLQLSNYNYSGYINSGNESSVTWTLNTIIQKNGYDSLQIRFNKFLFSTEADFDSGTSSHYICKEYRYNGSTNSYQCINWDSSSAYGPQTISNGTYYIRAISVNTDNINTPCYMTSEMEGSLICPINKDIKNIQFSIYQNGFSSFYYQYSISGVSAYWNNDSTEIVNGLSGVQQQQQNTTQAIEDLTTNINDNNISGANSSTNSALNGIDNTVSNTLDNSISANQLNTILTNFTNQLSNTTCSPITLPIPYTNENIILPCLGTEFSQRIPVIWALYELIITGVIVLRFWQHGVEFVFNVLDPYHIGANNVPTGGGK